MYVLLLGKFLLACALLDSGEHHKAFDIFNKAVHGISIGDTFIINKVIQSKETIRERLFTLYYLKVRTLKERGGGGCKSKILKVLNF